MRWGGGVPNRREVGRSHKAAERRLVVKRSSSRLPPPTRGEIN